MIAVPPTLRLLVHYDKTAKTWVACCVDFDMVTQASKLQDLPQAFGHVFFGTLLVALERNEPINLRPAPRHIQERWRQVSTKQNAVDMKAWKDFQPPWFADAFAAAIKTSNRLPRCEPPEQMALALAEASVPA